MTREGELHSVIIRYVVRKGFAPSMDELSKALGWPEEVLRDVLSRLAEIRGVILKPNSFDVWGIHPFTLMPTPTWVEADRGGWWANCAWCALGIGAALQHDVRIVTRLGAEQKTLELVVRDGRPSDDRLLVHFPFRPGEWWSNPFNPCGGILFFSSASDIDQWCSRHGFPRGEAIDVNTGVALAREWFGDCLEPTWSRKSADDARQVFRRLGLTGQFWQAP